MPIYQFFATPGDLLPGWEAVKNLVDLKFAYEGYRDNTEWPVYRSLPDLPGLGVATSGAVGPGNGYIILPNNEPLNIVKYKEGNKSTSAFNFDSEYFYSVLFLPYHMTFGYLQLGGFWMEQDVPNIIGYKLFCADGEEGVKPEFVEQFKLLGKSLIKGFTTVKMKPFGQWKAGPEALEMYRHGTRLIADQADLSYTTIIPEIIEKKTR